MPTGRRRILFYDDAPHFGGHEAMTLVLVEHLASQHRYDITFIASDLNGGLCERLQRVDPPILVLKSGYASGRGQWLRTYLSVRALWRLTRQIQSLEPELLIVVQGGVALSSLALLAGRLARVRTASYIPMTHDESMFARKRVTASLRRILVRPFYRLPHCLITISARMAAYVKPRRSGSIRIVENGIALSGIPLGSGSREAVRSALGLSNGDRLMLMVGRIEFWQKRHDLAVQALSIARSRGARMHLLVVGSGPDEAALKELVQAQGLADCVHFRGWQTDVSEFYAACEVLLIPSRYEGVPLVMLEAMYAGRKVLAADVDGMADMLPESWRFRAGDAQALAAALTRPENEEDTLHLRGHQQLIATNHTIDSYRKRFQGIIEAELEMARQ